VSVGLGSPQHSLALCSHSAPADLQLSVRACRVRRAAREDGKQTPPSPAPYYDYQTPASFRERKRKTERVREKGSGGGGGRVYLAQDALTIGAGEVRALLDSHLDALVV
jgi:hypothetical protein